MSVNILFYSILMLIFLVCSAFFSGMEAALFSLSRFRVKALIFEERRGARALERVKKEPGKTLAAILLANLLVNIGATSVGAIILLQIIARHNINTIFAFILQFIVMTSLLLLIGEITPKTIAIFDAEKYSLRFAGIIAFISRIFSPFSGVLERLTRRMIKEQSIKENALVSDKEIKLMLREAMEYRVLDQGEERFGYQILKFSKVRVNEIMTPRQKVVGILKTASIERVKRLIKAKRHSRICVFDEEENVVGVLYAKDVFMHESAKDTPVDLSDIMREPYITPETKSAENLLGEFRKKGIHIAIVVDEYGNFVGIVTLEDIIESLYGEIIDEYDEHGELSDIPYQQLAPDTYLFEGDINVGEVARILEIEPFAEEGERLSGYIMEQFTRIPLEDERIVKDHFEMRVEEVKGRLITKVRVKRIV
ncbi:HlyC/CorC family transporter [candidate division WOR-3 bacterium]|nr:HlyC/CorC family transporter [candidate division WOR-3 bacterium]